MLDLDEYRNDNIKRIINLLKIFMPIKKQSMIASKIGVDQGKLGFIMMKTCLLIKGNCCCDSIGY